MRATRRTWGLIAGTVLATAVSTLGLPLAPATAIDSYPIPVEGFSQNINIQAPIEVISGIVASGSLELILPPAQDGRQTATQCTSIPGTVSNMCVGQPAAADAAPPIEVLTQAEVLPMLKDPAAREALEWLELEGREAIRLQYDLPNDVRIARYARAEVRSYMVNRLLDIMDRSVYGVPLTTDETRALAFVQSTYQKREIILAEAAAAELADFQSRPCRYRPPAAPAVIPAAEVQKMPRKVETWCLSNHDYGQSMTNWVNIAPPLPSVATFAAWGSYAAAEELGLNAFSDPDVETGLAQTIIGTAATLGFALAFPAGLGAAALANAAGIAAKLGRILLPNLGRAFFRAVQVGAEVGSQMATAGGGAVGSALGGAVAAAIVAAVIVVAIIVIGVASWLVAEHESVVTGVAKLVTDAKQNKDPLGLAPLRKDLSGKPLNSELDPADPPTYRTGEAHQRLSAILTLKTIVMPDGSTVPDPQGVWVGSSSARVLGRRANEVDRKWVVKVDGGTAQLRDEIVVPQQADADAAFEYAKVRSVGGWFVVDTADTATRTTPPLTELTFGYNDRARADGSGTPRLVARAPSKLGGLIVTDTAYADGAGDAIQRTWISWKNAQGQKVEARLQNPPPTYLDGPRPAAVGPMYARRPVMLRPNPVASTGASVPQVQAEGDFEYVWTVMRRDPVSGEWDDVHTATTYGTSFVPTVAGAYDARVTMTALDNPDFQRFGAVAFSVTAPPILSPVAILEDNGRDRVELDLQLAEDVAADSMHLELTWPGTFDDPVGPTSTLDQECFQTGPLDCTTQRTGPSDLLVRTITPTTDLRQPVRLRVTNSTGAVLERQFFIGDERPSIAALPAGINDAELGTVEVSDTGTVVTMPLAPTGVDEFQSYSVARLLPGVDGGVPGFGLVDPATGNATDGIPLAGFGTGSAQVYEQDGEWYLGVEAVPRLNEVGTHEYTFLVESNDTRQTVPLTIVVTPTTEDRRRAAVASTVDPLAFAVADRPGASPMVVGGRTADAVYAGDMCVRLVFVDFGPNGPKNTWCGPMSDFYAADGEVRPFPYTRLFPAGMQSGTYRMDAWLTQVSSRVDNLPLGVSFILTDDDDYPDPTVWVASVGITGTTRVGRTLTAKPGSIFPTNAKLAYRWLRDGSPITGATGKTYVLKAADKGHRISVRLTATRTDYAKTVTTSARTAAVRAAS